MGRNLALYAEVSRCSIRCFCVTPVKWHTRSQAYFLRFLAENRFCRFICPDIRFSGLEQGQLSRSQFIQGDISRFTGREHPDVSVTPASRRLISQRLDQYGTWQAYYILRSGVKTKQKLIEALLERSGLAELKDLVLSHFGNRAYLIKLDIVIKRISEVCFWARQRENMQRKDWKILGKIESAISQLKDNEPGFSEFIVLRHYYQGKLQFTEDEVTHLLQVTGEYGLSDRQRLGLAKLADPPTEADLKEMLQLARTFVDYWRRRAIDSGANRETENAAGIIGDAYDRISYHTMLQLQWRGFTV